MDTIDIFPPDSDPERATGLSDMGRVNVPQSLSAQLDKLNRMVSMSEQAMNEGDHDLARARIKQCYLHLQALAQTAPEYSAVLAAAMQGHSGFVIESVEQTRKLRRETKTVLGVQLGSKVIEEPMEVRKQRTIRIF